MTTHTEHDEGPSAAGTGYEPTDVQPRPVAVSALFLVLLMLFGFLGGWFFYDQFQEMESAARPAVSPVYERHIPKGPLLQAAPGGTWSEYEKNQMDFLSSYGWVDSAKTTARVPVDVALERVAAEGRLPDFKARNAPAAPPADPADGAAEGSEGSP